MLKIIIPHNQHYVVWFVNLCDNFNITVLALSTNCDKIFVLKGYLLRALWEWNTMHAKASGISQTDFENLMYSFDIALFTLPTDEALNWYENQK